MEPGSVTETGNAHARLFERVQALARRVPAMAWAVSGLFLFAAILLAFYSAVTAGDATLRLKVQHGFHSAQFNVWVDNKQVYSGKLIGVMKKKFRMIPESVQGSLSEVLSLPAGEHQVRVRVVSDEGSVHENTIGGNFPSEGQRTLAISAQRDDLSLNWQGGSTDATHPSAEGWVAHYAGTLLLTAAGSIISALTGFAVKEIPGHIRARAASASKSQ